MYLKDTGAQANSDADWTHYSRPPPVQVWVKPQPAGALAVYVVNSNPTGKAASITVPLAKLGLSVATVHVRDIWSRQDVGQAARALRVSVAPLDSAFLMLSPQA